MPTFLKHGRLNAVAHSHSKSKVSAMFGHESMDTVHSIRINHSALRRQICAGDTPARAPAADGASSAGKKVSICRRLAGDVGRGRKKDVHPRGGSTQAPPAPLWNMYTSARAQAALEGVWRAGRRRFDSGMCVTTAFRLRPILPKKNNFIKTSKITQNSYQTHSLEPR